MRSHVQVDERGVRMNEIGYAVEHYWGCITEDAACRRLLCRRCSLGGRTICSLQLLFAVQGLATNTL